MIKSSLFLLFFIVLGFNANAQYKKDGTPDMRYKANKELYGNSQLSPIYSQPNSYDSGINSTREREYNNGGQLKLQNGYLRDNGTYVAPHVKTTPDNKKWNNLGSWNPD